MRRDLFLWLGALVCLGILGWAFYLVFSPFFQAIAWAVILAILLAPVQRWMGRWIDSKGWRALLTVLLAAILFAGPLFALGTALVNEALEGLRFMQANAGEYQQQLQDWNPADWGPLRSAQAWLRRTLGVRFDLGGEGDLLGSPDLQRAITDGAQGLSQWLLNQSSAIFRNLAELMLTFLVAWLTLFYLLRDGDRILKGAIELLPYPVERREAMLARLNDVVISSVYGGLAVAVTQGVLGGIAFAILGLPSPILWGTVMAFLAFLPLVGAFAVWIPAAVILAAQGAWGKCIFLVAWGLIVVGLVDNFLRPMLISGRTRMHPLPVFLAVLGGIQAFGFLGIFLGPVLVAVVTAVIELYREMVQSELSDAAGSSPGDLVAAATDAGAAATGAEGTAGDTPPADGGSDPDDGGS